LYRVDPTPAQPLGSRVVDAEGREIANGEEIVEQLDKEAKKAAEQVRNESDAAQALAASKGLGTLLAAAMREAQIGAAAGEVPRPALTKDAPLDVEVKGNEPEEPRKITRSVRKGKPAEDEEIEFDTAPTGARRTPGKVLSAETDDDDEDRPPSVPDDGSVATAGPGALGGGTADSTDTGRTRRSGTARKRR
jgi:hypothetical protein